jgi:hypothetical protein
MKANREWWDGRDERRQSKYTALRLGTFTTRWSFLNPGHEERMRGHIERVAREEPEHESRPSLP